MASAEVAILGAAGMLGRDLGRVLDGRRIAWQGFDLPDFNLTDPAHLAAVVGQFPALINCAAYTNVDRAESQPEVADAVNHRAVAELGRLAAAQGRYVLQLSTDFVYDGGKPGPYTEADAPAPLSVYGRTKWAGDQALQASGCRHAILRIEWTYGRHGDHFVSKLLRRARETGELRVVADQVGAPTPTHAVADALAEALVRRTQGLYLYAARGYASRFEVARAVVAHLALPVRVTPCATSDFPAPARRPLNSRFDCAAFDAAFAHRRPDWREALVDYLEHQP